MKTFVADIIPKIKKFSKQIDQRVVLINNNWIFINPEDGIKYTYIFKSGGELLLSANGNVTKGKWEQLNDGLLLIEDVVNQSILFRYDFFDGIVLALNKEGTQEHALFINESKSNMSFTTIQDINNFLSERYLTKTEPKSIGNGPRKQQELLVWLLIGAIVLGVLLAAYVDGGGLE